MLGPLIDNMSILVTTYKDDPSEKVHCGQVMDEDNKLLPLVNASVDLIADTIIDERHPFNVPEVFEFYALAFKPMSEAATLAYKECLDRSS